MFKCYEKKNVAATVTSGDSDQKCTDLVFRVEKFTEHNDNLQVHAELVSSDVCVAVAKRLTDTENLFRRNEQETVSTRDSLARVETPELSRHVSENIEYVVVRVEMPTIRE